MLHWCWTLCGAPRTRATWRTLPSLQVSAAVLHHVQKWHLPAVCAVLQCAQKWRHCVHALGHSLAVSPTAPAPGTSPLSEAHLLLFEGLSPRQGGSQQLLLRAWRIGLELAVARRRLCDWHGWVLINPHSHPSPPPAVAPTPCRVRPIPCVWRPCHDPPLHASSGQCVRAAAPKAPRANHRPRQRWCTKRWVCRCKDGVLHGDWLDSRGPLMARLQARHGPTWWQGLAAMHASDP